MANHEKLTLSPNRSTDSASAIKSRQLQQYLHYPGRIPATVHPFVKMAQGQSNLPQSGPQRHNLIKVRRSPLAALSSLGVLLLVKFPKAILIKLPGRSKHNCKDSPFAFDSGQAEER
ncbi:hypothetical protein FEK30_16165 (plasmid) [Picosynechococcus sp. PCC 11901]|uniref:hypothetical protein n=1 Tax=Picosynechococcus sp. PCC 11901 TaxID=2579791 RepID=UPI0010FBE9F2|nr:hypothetical protein [Picosynechococcus sp. PCC 11901]QCS51049.1 hypothetical protein FEK30_16165 [Picosynechococcus sp. PCC 11901]